MNCSNCGSPIEPGKKFCGDCGQPVIAEPPPTEAPPPLPDDIPTQMVEMPAPPEPRWILARPGLEPIELGERLLLGRGTDCDYVLDDTQASRQHALIEKGDDGFTLTDQDSSNGTFVNEERIYGPVLLSEGDAVRIGQTTFTFELQEVDEEAAQAEAEEIEVASLAEPVAPAEPEPKAAPVEPPAEPLTPVEPPEEAAPVEEQAMQFCPECGAAIEPGIAFCGECGHHFSAAPEQPASAVPPGVWDPEDSLEPQPINPKRLYFSRKGLGIGCLVIVALGLALTCFIYVLDYLVGLLM